MIGFGAMLTGYAAYLIATSKADAPEDEEEIEESVFTKI